MSKVYEFLKKNNMLFESFSREEIKAEISDEIKNKTSMSMFDSYQIPVFMNETLEESILAIDAGGTNLRFAVYKKGSFVYEEKQPMPGSKDTISSDEFFDFLTNKVESFRTEYEISKIGFCFSFPFEVLPNKDGKVIHLDKEVHIEGIEGKFIGEEINKRLKKKMTVSLLNDTVAAQLGSFSDFGIIIGTGFNICYTDFKLGHIINSECGQAKILREGTFDKKVISMHPNMLVCTEMLIGGIYLTDLIKITTEEYFGLKMPEFSLADASEFIDTGIGRIETVLNKKGQRDEFTELVSLLLTRAAKYVALLIECFIESNQCKDKKYIYSLGLEGSTIYKLPGYMNALKFALLDIPNAQFVLKDARNKIALGCVMATRD